MSRRSSVKRCVAVVLVGLSCSAVAAEVRIPRRPGVPPAAEEIIADFEAQADEILARSRTQHGDLRARTTARLQDLLTARMQAADLDGALAIREMIRSLERTEPGLPYATGTMVLPAPRAVTLTVTDHAPQPAPGFQNDPGELSAYRTRLGERFYFRVRGTVEGSGVWGTDLYTHDSSLARAAVHAGALNDGEAGVVLVTILKGPATFSGCSRNGVTSSDWNNSDGYYTAFRVERADPDNFMTPGTLRFTPAFEAARTAPVLADPGDLGAYHNRIGESFLFEVTGSDDGTAWGTDSYTYDSDLSTAAMHAGLVPRGEKRVICAIIEPGAARFFGSTRHGVTTHNWDNSGGHYTAFRLQAMETPAVGYRLLHDYGTSPVSESASALPPIPLPDPGNLLAFRGLNGRDFYFHVTGAAGSENAIWGTEIYTDDSHLATAAVHAGALRAGEIGLVKVTILPGRKTYEGTVRYGVRSESYADYGGSYRVERFPGEPADDASIRTSPQATIVGGGTVVFPSSIGLTDSAAVGNVLTGGITLNVATPEVRDVSGDTDMQSVNPGPGRVYYLRIKGRNDGQIWGSDVYTSDSSVGTAAVHAGVLKAGKTGVVKVTIVPGQTAYESTTRHGITSSSYRSWDVSYRVDADDRPK
jgi:hypothetical protein